jgi:tetratricopeptide (TPR) repeat protein
MDKATRAMLKNLMIRSVDDFNRFRKENPALKIDITTMKLNDLNLSGIDFSNASLCYCKFLGTNLENANFSGANLSYANFFGAKMKGANLDRTTVAGTDFTKADLRGASLRNLDQITETKFINADMRDANLFETRIGPEMFTGAKFTEVKPVSLLKGGELLKSRLSEFFNKLTIVVVVLAFIAFLYLIFLTISENKFGGPGELLRAKIECAAGAISSAGKDYNGAASHFRKAIKLTPTNTDLYFRLGETLEKEGKKQEALQVYKEGEKAVVDPDGRKKLVEKINSLILDDGN